MINRLADFSEALDLWHQCVDFLEMQAEQLPSHHSVLPASKVWVKSHAQLK
ncbi:hypothetical protein D3C81_2122140 [compost metagenome]